MTLEPRDEADLAEILAGHAGPLAPRGHGSKQAIGRPVDATPLSLAALAGIIDYQPAELVVTLRACTPLATLEAALDAAGQRLAFEPPSYAMLLGTPEGQTVGGVIAANLSGSRRVTAGAARDHFLGFRAVSGRGERFRAGGQVVKNVTGYDLPKLLAGSWGTLAVLTEVTLKAMPRPEAETTLVFADADVAGAVHTMSVALGSPHDVSAAAHCPRRGITWLRVEGFAGSVRARCASLASTLAREPVEQLATEASRATWRGLGGAEPLAGCAVVWRVSVPPTEAPRVLDTLRPDRSLLDWGGGLLWLGFDTSSGTATDEAHASRVRGAVTQGHATLVVADAATRARIPAFPPPAPAHAALAARVKAAFDPDGRLNPGRMD